MSSHLDAAVPSLEPKVESYYKVNRQRLRKLDSFPKSNLRITTKLNTPMIFDLPVTYNPRVRKWINYFQNGGHKWFRKWLERSYRHIPTIEKILEEQKLPKDLAYVAMIESGFSSKAISSASAVGPWQFISSTGEQYGLQQSWWIDERRDFYKSTHAAARYLRNLYKMFDSWHMAAAAYNMGENRLKRLTKKYKTSKYWELSLKPSFAKETKDYVPKLMAAILISKAPALYGFRDLRPHPPLEFDYVTVPGGTDLIRLANQLNVTHKHIKDLNPDLIEGFIPDFVHNHKIRVPKGASKVTKKYALTMKGIDLAKKNSLN